MQEIEQVKIVSIEALDWQVVERLASSGIYVKVIGREGKTIASLKNAKPVVLICRDRDDVAGIIDSVPSIRFIFVVEVGVEELPFQKLLDKNIRVANCSGISADIMSNYAMSCILGHCSKTKENILNQQSSFWKRYQCTESLQQKILLVVGAGRTGKEIARKAKVFGMKTIGVQRTPRVSDFFDQTICLKYIEDFLPVADYVVCSIPQTPLTERLFTIARFRLMKQDAVFVNISRGAIVVEDDLLEALDEGKVDQAFLDVFDKEPLPKTSRLWTHPKVLVSPHQSGRLKDFMSKAMDIFAENYKAFTRGETMPNEVCLIQGY